MLVSYFCHARPVDPLGYNAQLAVLREQFFVYNHVPEELEGEWSKLVD